MKTKIRQPAVAGFFYPATPKELRRMIEGFLGGAKRNQENVGKRPKALIVPHAGYLYSGGVAASAFITLQGNREIRRVVLLGPAHRVGFIGLALPTSDIFQTPLGEIPIDKEALREISPLPQVIPLDRAHTDEHSLEVELPFLQELLPPFSLVPLVVGEAAPHEVGEVIEKLWGDETTLILISSDLSHYHPYEEARKIDRKTSEAIVACRYEEIGPGDACGRNPINGLLYVARKQGLKVELLDLRNSGDTAGDKQRVVGYGAYALWN